jgi:hypothetical protein
MAIFTALSSAFTGLGAWFAGLGVFGKAFLKIGLGLIINKAAASLAGKPKQTPFGVVGKIQRGADIPQSFILGKYATAGSFEWGEEFGSAGGTPNAYFVQVIELSNLPVNGLDGVWIDGERQTIISGEDHSDFGSPILEKRVGSTDYAWVKFYDGNQTTADPWLSTAFTTGDWALDSNFIGLGNAYAIVVTRFNQDLFNGYANWLFEIDGVPLLDPTTSSVGGDGDYDPTVQVYNLLKGFEYNGDWFYGGQKIQLSQLPTSHFAFQQAKTQPDFQSGLEVAVNAEIASTIEEILAAAGGRISETGGVYKTLMVSPDAPVMSFTDDDIITTEEQSFTPFYGLADAINGISAVYPSPSQGWATETAPPLFDSDFEEEDDGRRLLADVQFPAVTDDEQVQRLMAIALKEARRARRHTITFPPRFWVIDSGDTISWSSDRNGYTNKEFRVDGVLDLVNGDVLLDITEIDSTDYSWNRATDYTPIDPSPVVWPDPPIQAVGNFGATQSVLTTDGGSNRISAIAVSWDNSVLDDLFAIRIQVQRTSDDSVVFDKQILEVSEGIYPVSENIVGGTEYRVRAKFVPYTNRQTSWTGYITLTTTDVRLGLDGLDSSISDTIDSMASDIIENALSASIALSLTGDPKFINTDKKQWAVNSDLTTLLPDSSTYDPRVTIVSSTDPEAGGNDIVCNGQVDLYHTTPVQIDTSRKYKMRIRVKREAVVSSGDDDARLRVGFRSYDNADVRLTNGTWCVANNLTLTEFPVSSNFVEFVSDIITGEASSGTNSFRVGTTAIRPAFQLNRNNGVTGDIMRLSEWFFEDVTDVEATSSSAADADQSRIDAETASSAASVSESNAAASATSAAGDAAAAQASKEVAIKMYSEGAHPNPIFENWDSAEPDNYQLVDGIGTSVSSKNTNDSKYNTNCVEMTADITEENNKPYLYTRTYHEITNIVQNPKAVRIVIELELISGTWGNCHIRHRWLASSGGTNSSRIKHYISDFVDNSETGIIHRIEMYAERPDDFVAGSGPDDFYRTYLYSNDNENQSIGGLTKSNKTYRVHSYQIQAVLGESQATITQTALGTVEGHLSSAVTLRAEAGSGGATLELVAADDTENGSASTARIHADNIILDGTIQSAKIANAAISEAKIEDAAITNAKIADIIESDNFVAGSAGWQIDFSGDAEFNSLVVREGNLESGAATDLHVDTDTRTIGFTRYSDQSPSWTQLVTETVNIQSGQKAIMTVTVALKEVTGGLPAYTVRVTSPDLTHEQTLVFQQFEGNYKALFQFTIPYDGTTGNKTFTLDIDASTGFNLIGGIRHPHSEGTAEIKSFLGVTVHKAAG